MKPYDPSTPLIKLSICVVIAPRVPSSIVDIGLDDAARSLADAHLTLARQQRLNFNETFTRAVDTAVSAGPSAQATVDNARKLEGEQVFGAMINALDTLVKIGDEISMVCS